MDKQEIANRIQELAQLHNDKLRELIKIEAKIEIYQEMLRVSDPVENEGAD